MIARMVVVEGKIERTMNVGMCSVQLQTRRRIVVNADLERGRCAMTGRCEVEVVEGDRRYLDAKCGEDQAGTRSSVPGGVGH